MAGGLQGLSCSCWLSMRSRPTVAGAHSIVKELTDTGWPLPTGFALQPGDRAAKSGALKHQLENFKAMCALYVGGDQQYVLYTVQSGNAHPSYIGAMATPPEPVWRLRRNVAVRNVL
jgi:hypothetical protein